MKAADYDCEPSREEWELQFGRYPDRKEREGLLANALIGERAWASLLTVKGKPLTTKRVRGIVADHTHKNRLFVSGPIFSYECAVMLSWQFSDGRRKWPIPICFNTNRLKSEWNAYQRRKRGMRASAAHKLHHGVEGPAPRQQIELETLRELEFANDEVLPILITPSSEPAVVRQGQNGFQSRGGFFRTMEDAVTDACNELVAEVFDLESDRMFGKGDLDVVAHFYESRKADALAITMGDRSTVIRRVVPIRQSEYRSPKKRLAERMNIGFFNLYEAMGGDGSMVSWVGRGMAAKDYIHFSRSGGRRVARLIYRDIMKRYTMYTMNRNQLRAGN